MNLEKIEMSNFKSYKGTYVVGPFDRFSCIVGPNGSGKSNILDALSFVLNVPNSFLRVKYLKNLIAFQEHSASVKIFVSGKTFERTIYHSDSASSVKDSICLDPNVNEDISKTTGCKYFIDGKKVTQKDYNKELESINILNKVKNFVIYQGDIIKSEVDLLALIENVCGSDIYKDEYKRLEDKIALMNKDLSIKYEKRKDILELMKEMKDVVEKEKTFGKLVTEKEEAQKKLYELEVMRKKFELSNLKERLGQLEKIKQEQNYPELFESVNKIRMEASKLQKDYFEKETELSFARNRNIKTNLYDFEAKELEMSEMQASLQKCKEDIKRYETAFEFEKFSFADGSPITKQKFEELLAEKEKEYFQAISHLEKKLSEITLKNFDKITKRDQLSQNIKQLKSKLTKFTSRNKEIEKENIAKIEKLATIEKQIKFMQGQVEDKLSAYEKILLDEQRLNDELNQVTKDILLNKAKKNDITKRSLVKSVVSNLKTLYSGVHGRVIDLIEPTQRKYEIAIGTLLAKHDQSVIVDSEKTALDCLRYIKDTKSCKLTFLPMSRIKEYSNNENLSNLNSVIDCKTDNLSGLLAKNCVTYDKKYANIISFIFRNALIVESVDQAKHILYRNNYNGFICTLDGTLFADNGLIVGGKGTINKFEESFVDELLRKRKNIVNDLRVIKDRKEAFADVEAVRLKINDLKEKKETIKIEKIDYSMAKEYNTDEAEKELKELEADLEDFELNEKAIKESKKQIEKAIIGPVLSMIGMHSLSEYRDRMKEDIKRNELLIRAQSIKDSITALEEEIRFHKNNASVVAEKIDVDKMELELNKVYNALENVKEKLKAQNSYLKTASLKRDELNNSILSYQVQISRTEDTLKDILQMAELEFNIKLDVSLNDNPVTNENAIFEQILNLKSRIDFLNQELSRNLPTCSASDSSIHQKFTKVDREYELAKIELNEVKKTFLEIKRQRFDLFNSCFNTLSQELPIIYKRLTMQYDMDTSESNGYVVYEGDPFVNNVKYYLMFPGKRFTPFNELSGGEKSIALLSFLFALNKYRSPPFYIFDEIDSALDKMNVEKLANYIDEENGQFIVVSHKLQLFSRADSLFGVYKSPIDQSSQILSLKLNK